MVVSITFEVQGEAQDGAAGPERGVLIHAGGWDHRFPVQWTRVAVQEGLVAPPPYHPANAPDKLDIIYKPFDRHLMIQGHFIITKMPVYF
jgi:hypothetical protein